MSISPEVVQKANGVVADALKDQAPVALSREAELKLAKQLAEAEAEAKKRKSQVVGFA